MSFLQIVHWICAAEKQLNRAGTSRVTLQSGCCSIVNRNHQTIIRLSEDLLLVELKLNVRWPTFENHYSESEKRAAIGHSKYVQNNTG